MQPPKTRAENLMGSKPKRLARNVFAWKEEERQHRTTDTAFFEPPIKISKYFTEEIEGPPRCPPAWLDSKNSTEMKQIPRDSTATDQNKPPHQHKSSEVHPYYSSWTIIYGDIAIKTSSDQHTGILSISRAAVVDFKDVEHILSHKSSHYRGFSSGILGIVASLICLSIPEVSGFDALYMRVVFVNLDVYTSGFKMRCDEKNSGGCGHHWRLPS
ncbi:hypothetical protein O988_08711 [Pseudogymnoascus sp. VKM F-3808]|nr:hypothetical protein O988_08711 [Pseudogymnoascus sp. VKM F-3808]